MELEKENRSGNKKVDDYIQRLENHIQEFEASNIYRLIVSCDSVAGIIADDIQLLKENGSDDEIDNKLQMMGSKKNKIYQRYRDVISDIKHFKTIHDLVNELKPKSSTKEIQMNTEPETNVVPKKIRKNIQDFVFNKEE